MINEVKFVSGVPVSSMAVYSCGAYGAGSYDSACTTSTGGNTGGSGDGGGLPDTGYNILLPLALGAALIIAALILVVKRVRRNRKSHVTFQK